MEVIFNLLDLMLCVCVCLTLSLFFTFLPLPPSPSLSLSVSLRLSLSLPPLSLSLSPYSEGHDREDLFLPNLQDKFLLGIKDSLAAVGSSAPFIVVVMSGSSVDLTVAKVQRVYNTCYASTLWVEFEVLFYQMHCL